MAHENSDRTGQFDSGAGKQHDKGSRLQSEAAGLLQQGAGAADNGGRNGGVPGRSKHGSQLELGTPYDNDDFARTDRSDRDNDRRTAHSGGRKDHRDREDRDDDDNRGHDRDHDSKRDGKDADDRKQHPERDADRDEDAPKRKGHHDRHHHRKAGNNENWSSASGTPTEQIPVPTSSGTTGNGNSFEQPSPPPNQSGGDGTSAPSAPGSNSGDGTSAPSAPGSNGGDSAPPTSSPTGQFTVKNGEIIGPDGKRFIPKGVAIGGEAAISDEQTLLKDFPGMNMVRLTTSPDGQFYWNSSDTPTGKAPSQQQIEQFINDMTKRGIVVEIDPHDSEPGQKITAQTMAEHQKWVSQLAAAEKDNPYVWFQTPNEPNTNKNSGSAVVNEQVSYYNAVRDAGNNNMVTMELPENGNAAQQAADAQAYANMKNIAFDYHLYNGDPQKVDRLENSTAKITDTQGKIPGFFGEFGNTMPNGRDMAPNPSAALAAIFNSGEGGVAWSYRNMGGNSDVNQLANSDGSLTDYGKEVAQWIAS